MTWFEALEKVKENGGDLIRKYGGYRRDIYGCLCRACGLPCVHGVTKWWQRDGSVLNHLPAGWYSDRVDGSLFDAQRDVDNCTLGSMKIFCVSASLAKGDRVDGCSLLTWSLCTLFRAVWCDAGL